MKTSRLLRRERVEQTDLRVTALLLVKKGVWLGIVKHVLMSLEQILGIPNLGNAASETIIKLIMEME